MPTLDASAGLRLHYLVDDFTDPWTKPDTVLLLHGNAESSLAWYAWVLLLARRFRVVRPDMRGYGASTPMPRDFAWSLDVIIFGYYRPDGIAAEFPGIEDNHLAVPDERGRGQRRDGGGESGEALRVIAVMPAEEPHLAVALVAHEAATRHMSAGPRPRAPLNAGPARHHRQGAEQRPGARSRDRDRRRPRHGDRAPSLPAQPQPVAS